MAAQTAVASATVGRADAQGTSAGPSSSSDGDALVDVGRNSLHAECSGEGSPAVVLEAGFSSGASGWSRVRPTVAAFTRGCAYDRANRG